MTTLRAISLSQAVAGILLGPSFVGFVHSVCDTHVCLVSSNLCAINVEWDDLGKSVNGVTVKRPDDVKTFLTYGITKGTECRRTGNVLLFLGCDCTVLLENVDPWNPKLLEFAAKDKYEFYKDNAEFLLNCLSIKFKNESMERIGLAPIGLLANSGDNEYLEKAVQQEWRLHLLIHLFSLINHYRHAEIQQAISAAVRIFEIGEITHNLLIGFCAALWVFGVRGTQHFQEGIKQIIQKMRKQVFISEAETILAFQGNFSEKLHQMVRDILEGEETQTLLNSLDNFSTGCILGICIGVKMICSDNDEWIAGIIAYLPKEKTTLKNSNENINTSNNNNNNNDSYFRISSWRKMLNL